MMKLNSEFMKENIQNDKYLNIDKDYDFLPV